MFGARATVSELVSRIVTRAPPCPADSTLIQHSTGPPHTATRKNTTNGSRRTLSIVVFGEIDRFESRQCPLKWLAKYCRPTATPIPCNAADVVIRFRKRAVLEGDLLVFIQCPNREIIFQTPREFSSVEKCSLNSINGIGSLTLV